ncbi:MAG: phosphoadenylyl-sulfate reductase [Actinobacteria bacterium]|nr:phosphoadenylyl-sulfate reductase [Actinomycetota bacterium]
MDLLLPPDLVREVNERLEGRPPRDVLDWALLESGLDRIAVASSFQAETTVLMHMAVQVKPDVPILFLETGFHFAETLAFKERLTERLGLNVIDLRGDVTPDTQAARHGERLYERDPGLCCELNKVIPLKRALRDLDAWITGLRRDSSPTRADAPIVDQYELEPGKTLVKVNPMANWTRNEVWTYIRDHDLPTLPLYRLGYMSIGCAPCSRALFPGEDERAGRWAGRMKAECGIHVAETARDAEEVTPTARGT